MSQINFTRNSDGKVTDAPVMIEGWLAQLIERFENNLKPWEEIVMNNLVHLWDQIPSGFDDDAQLNSKGWDEFIATFRETEELIYGHEPTVELTEDAYNKLEERLMMLQETNPSLTREDLLSSLILAIPMPEG